MSKRGGAKRSASGGAGDGSVPSTVGSVPSNVGSASAGGGSASAGGGESVFIPRYECRSVIQPINSKEKTLTFTPEINAGIIGIMKSTIRNKKEARNLRFQMEDAGIIAVGCSHEDIMSNGPLQRLILATLAVGLPTTIVDSAYSKLVSDFDLYTNCNTEPKLTTFIKTRNLKVNLAQYQLISASSKKLVNLITRTKNNMIDDMEFDGAPDRSSRKKLKSQDEVQQQMTRDKELCESATANANQKQGGKDDEDNDEDIEDDEPEEGITETSSASSSSSSSSSVKTVSKKVTDKVVDVFPELLDGAHLQLINGILGLVL